MSNCSAAALDVLQACMRGAPEARMQVKRVISQSYGQYDRMTMDASVMGPEARRGLGSVPRQALARLGAGRPADGPAVSAP
jgi:hypothetical protein